MTAAWLHCAFYVAGMATGFLLLLGILWLERAAKQRRIAAQPPFTTTEAGR